MNVQRMRSSCERWPHGATSAFGRRASLVVWSTKPRTYTTAEGRRVLPNKGTVILRGDAR